MKHALMSTLPEGTPHHTPHKWIYLQIPAVLLLAHTSCVLLRRWELGACAINLNTWTVRPCGTGIGSCFNAASLGLASWNAGGLFMEFPLVLPAAQTDREAWSRDCG